MCNLLSQFVSKLSEICATLREIINMNAEVCWSTVSTYIKDVITSSAVLQYFDSAKPVILQVDASDDGLSVAYTSSTMTKSQKDNCDEIEKGA